MSHDLAVPPAEVLVGLERLALEVATEAARLVEDRPDDLGAVTKSSATDVVTAMDRASQDLVRRRLLAARPDDGFLGEEDGARPERPGGGVTWVVDPIDGTTNYLYGIPLYAVSVAAVVGDPTRPGRWRPVAGAVVNPATGESYAAHLGGGARRTDAAGRRVALRPSAADDLGLTLLGTGFSYDAGVRAWQARVLAHVLPVVRDIRRGGSAALDLCHVADGRLDAYHERMLNPWDLAAGWLVATEAGAVVGGSVVSGGRSGHGDPGPDLAWACAPALAGPFADLLRQAYAVAGEPPAPA